ncbi:methyltransferase domain-containing protein [Stieleria sp. ICT_E10.1]|uniref:class I SAM-dependent methyltransferase n=1 Tax=Stieleria sedimenti TaxID=2976331 RepID=UPI00217FD0AB|nr:methyltransferase domain-containing protein [Stieleria sedimenti]MCS7466974.1 methyltransferase domain-containing protein [Stieleria sedimenti]
MSHFAATCRRISRAPRTLVSRVLSRQRSTATKRDQWFVDYHSDHARQVVGLRDKTDERLKLFRVEDIAGKRVLDAGCNMGAIVNHCMKLGAHQVTGLDFDGAAVQRARGLYSDPTSVFRCDDLDNPLAALEPHDTVMFLSVYGTKELEDRNSILSRLAGLSQVMYFEGHHGDDPRDYAWVLLKFGGFQTIEFLGYTNDELREDSVGRPFFRCDRKPRDVGFLAGFIADHSHIDATLKVAVVGRSGAGKSHLARQLADDQRCEGVTILDDVNDPGRIHAAQRLVLFDYRAGTYIDQIDALFFLDVDENVRLKRFASDPVRQDDYNALLRTPPVRSNFLSFFRIEAQQDG